MVGPSSSRAGQIIRSMSPSRRRASFESDDADSFTERKGSGSAKRTRSRLVSLHRKSAIDPHLQDNEEQFILEWKLTYAQENEKLTEFRDRLKELKVLKRTHDIYLLRRFLRARQHNVDKATDMFLAHLKWREENKVDTIMKDFVFQERDAFISLYPQGYHQTDKQGRPIFIQHLGQIDMTKLNAISNEDRMIKFHIQEYERCVHYIMPACSKVKGRHIDSTFAIIDVKGVGLKHFTGDVKKMLSRILSIDQNNYPEMMGHTCIINAPVVFKAIWSFIRPMLDARTAGKIEMPEGHDIVIMIMRTFQMMICPTKYLPALLEWMDKESLPEYLGGTSKATLLDDAGPWQDPALIAEIDAEWNALTGATDIKEEAEAEAPSTGHDEAVPSSEKRGAELEPHASLGNAGPTAQENGQGIQSAPAPVGDGAGAPTLKKLKLLDSFADVDFHDAESMMRAGSIRSVGSEDEAFFSPRSVGAGSDAFGDHLDQSGEHGSPQVHPPMAAGTTVLERVRALESKLPGLKEKLGPYTHPGDDARISTAASGEGASLMARVDALEDAVRVLMTAQVRARPKLLNSPTRPLLEGSPLKQPLLGDLKGSPIDLPVHESSPGDIEPHSLISKLLTIEQELEMLVFEQESQLSQQQQGQDKALSSCCGGCSIM